MFDHYKPQKVDHYWNMLWAGVAGSIFLFSVTHDPADLVGGYLIGAFGYELIVRQP